MPHIENATASGFQRLPSPLVMKYIGPPCKTPLLSFPLYIRLSEHVKNFVAIPTIAVIHIQKRAPGPPIVIATATPAMLPKPTVAAIAVDNA